MRLLGWVGRLLLVAAALGQITGCTSTGSAPGPSLFGDSARPAESSRVTFFGSSAVRLDVYPVESTNPVRKPCLLVASVLDVKGQPLKGRRVDWLLEGAGSLSEVDESGIIGWRGRKTDNQNATTYTNYREHRIKRGPDAKDDVVIRPGQTWIILNSAVDGDAAVTVHAPSVSDKDKNKAYVNCRWVDAGWRFPAAASAPIGTEQILATHVFRLTDQHPLGNYRVRYRVLDGPQALILQSRAPEIITATDARGAASISLVQMTPQSGSNRIGIEILRPAEATGGGPGVVVARSETRIDWLTPVVELKHLGPASVGIGADIPYTIAVTNKGRVEILALTMGNAVPDEVQYVRSEPPAIVNGKQLLWTLGKLQPGQTHLVKTVFRSSKPGSVRSCVSLRTAEGLKDEQCATTQVAQPGVKVAVTGPSVGAVGQALSYQMTVSNPTPVPIAGAVVIAKFDAGLQHERKVNSMDLNVGSLAPNEVRQLPVLTLIPLQVGKHGIKVKVQADGNLSDETEQVVTAHQPQLAVEVLGPKTRYVGLPAEWEIKVTNTGDTPVGNVVLRNRLPAELRYQSSSLGGQMTGTEVQWTLGTLQPREHKSVALVAHCEQRSAAATQQIVVNADPGLNVTEQAKVEIVGVPAFRIKVKDDGDPAEVGKRVTYRIEVTNTGTMHADQVEIKAVLPPQMQLVSGGARGPSAATGAGTTVIFAKVDGHQPGQTLVYTIETEAKQTGDARLRVELTSPTLRQPVVRTESTQVYDAAGS
jgi:uncharacterized repeat protein (TIGR01451 family)